MKAKPLFWESSEPIISLGGMNKIHAVLGTAGGRTSVWSEWVVTAVEGVGGSWWPHREAAPRAKLLKKSAWLLHQIGDKPLLVPRDGREAARALN